MSYLGKAPGAPGGVRQVYEFVATAGQTTFSGADRNGATLSYDPGFANVFVGGVMLSQADVTATSGSSIVLLSGVPAGKIVQIEAFGTFKVADALTIAGGAVNSYLTTPTAPQFDNGSKLATTAFVKRAGLRFNSRIYMTADTTLTASQVGNLIEFGGSAIAAVTLPSATTVPDGEGFWFFNDASVNVNVVPQSSEYIGFSASSSAASIVVQPGETMFVVSNGGNKWLAASSQYGATAARFDYTTKLATTAWVQGNGFQFRNVSGIGIGADMTLSASQVGGWGQFQGVGKTLTLPSLASLVPGSTFTVQGAATGGTLKAATGDVIIAADMSSANTLTILPNETITVVSNGTSYGWFAVANGVGGRGFANLKTNNGYQKLPGGMILQWGMASANNAVATQTNAVTFPTAFPTNPVMVLTDHVGNVSNANTIVVSGTVTTTGFSWGSDYVGGSMSVFWMALGY